ncbi:STM3941 family protein [Streptococcus sp. S784/96/1]|uniref:STM3941 family protein n=1 Tax=Streptococcus sp. S784/96/1 TaxID=2653499 RepID=UPI003FD0E78B
MPLKYLYYCARSHYHQECSLQCAVIFFKRLIFPRPLLIVNDDGILDQSAAIRVTQTIPWKDIKDIQLTYYFTQTFISAYLFNEEKYLNRINSWAKKAYLTNRKLGFPLVNIILNTSNQKPEDILATIEQNYGERY